MPFLAQLPCKDLASRCWTSVPISPRSQHSQRSGMIEAIVQQDLGDHEFLMSGFKGAGLSFLTQLSDRKETKEPGSRYHAGGPQMLWSALSIGPWEHSHRTLEFMGLAVQNGWRGTRLAELASKR